MTTTPPPHPRHIVFLCWRDTGHPDGGGSELYVEHMARSLAADGHRVTIVCSDYPGAVPDECRDGIHFRRRGHRLSVYLRGLQYLLTAEGRRAEVVVDVQNGIPFFSPLVRRASRTVVLVHHVHREQWQIVYPGWRGRLGWWLESVVSPWLYRTSRYITVSESSAAELIAHGVDAARVEVVGNGIDRPHPSRRSPRAAEPTLCVLGRMVPHKRVEHALQTLAELADELPTLTLDVIGEGWWRDPLQARAEQLGITDRVRFHGYVDDVERDRLLDTAWVHLMPSVKEGWGIAVMEAAAHAVPTVAYLQAGGVRESVQHGETGMLVTDLEGLTAAARRLLLDTSLRVAMGTAARTRAARFEWSSSTRRFAQTVLAGSARQDQRLP